MVDVSHAPIRYTNPFWTPEIPSAQKERETTTLGLLDLEEYNTKYDRYQVSMKYEG